MKGFKEYVRELVNGYLTNGNLAVTNISNTFLTIYLKEKM